MRDATDFSYADDPDFPRVVLPPDEKRKLLAFMTTRGELFCATAGHFDDATSGKPVEDRSWGWYRVGGWQWSDREIYHVENYDLALDPAFVSYAVAHVPEEESPVHEKEGQWSECSLREEIGSEGGRILDDEEYKQACRITRERCESYDTITCGAYGEFMYTAFASSTINLEAEGRHIFLSGTRGGEPDQIGAPASPEARSRERAYVHAHRALADALASHAHGPLRRRYGTPERNVNAGAGFVGS